MSKSNYWEAMILNATFRAGTFVPPPNLYIGLFTTSISDAGLGTEVSGNAYARAQLNPGSGNWKAPTAAGDTSNLVAIEFNEPTGAWGTITHFGIFDSLTGGNLLYHTALSLPSVLNAASGVPSFSVGSLVVIEG